MRNTLPATLLRPWPSDMLKFSSAILRSASALWPSGITSAVSTGLYSSGFWQRISRPQARAAARVASPWRACRANTLGRPSSSSIAIASCRP